MKKEKAQLNNKNIVFVLRMSESFGGQDLYRCFVDHEYSFRQCNTLGFYEYILSQELDARISTGKRKLLLKTIMKS